MWTISPFHVHVCQIDDNISAKHSQEVINTPDIVPTKRKQSKKGVASTMTTPSSMDAATMELMFDRMTNRMMNQLTKQIGIQMERGTDKCAQVTWTI